MWLKSDDKFCSGSPLKRLRVKFKAIAHKRNTTSDQVLWQDYNSFWFKFWLYLIKAEMDKKKDKVLDKTSWGIFAMATIEFKSLQYWS